MPPAVEVLRLEKRYRGRVALAGIDLAVPSGEVFGLVGPNGAGKTTLLRILVGVVRPTGGEARALGHRLPAQALDVRRRTGYLPGDANLYERMRGAEFLAFALDGYAAIDRALERRLLEAFALPLGDRVRAYSHGMKRKLALAAALLPDVPLYVLDEPTEGLDPSMRQVLLEVLREQRSRGRTILLSSHDLAEVERVCDRVAFLHAGAVLDCDTIEGIRKKTARFLRATFRDPLPPEALARAGLAVAGREGETFLLRVDGDPAAALRSLLDLPVASLEWNRPSLADLYTALYGARSCSSVA
ncbi:MAG TPA: ABC transporter ATP-binding protein [Planctomycetota bacterium]|jgi:ABC-2 type transport system ATP-binding protein|nr:ABC transporter ATP-binding protein [Planctomycetota bacterium]